MVDARRNKKRSADGSAADAGWNQTKQAKEKTLVAPIAEWHTVSLPPLSTAPPNRTPPRHVLEDAHEYAKKLLNTENQAQESVRDSTTSKFYSTIVSSGTLSDKTSALTLAVQESPIHNVKALESLVALARKRSRAQAVDVLSSLKDLFAQGSVLPSDRKLRHFSQQPALLTALSGQTKFSPTAPLPGGLEKVHLLLWAFESYLKDQYFEIIKILEVWCNDEIEFARTRAVTFVYELLKEKPEQEANLLRLLVNKLGDSNKKIASRASYLLLQLQLSHPLMKYNIISVIESDILFRPGQTYHAKYYAVITLNQTVLSRTDEKTAAKLLDIYFRLFVTLLKQKADAEAVQNKGGKKQHEQKLNKKQTKKRDEALKGLAQQEELREKLFAGLLTGVNRAYPFTNADTERLSQHIDTLFRITHSTNFNTSLQALMLIQQLVSSHHVSSNRFYRTLYETLLDPRIITSSKQALYLNLLFKSLKADMNVKRIQAFIKRLLQILSLHTPSFACGVLFLIRELEKAFPSIANMLDKPEFGDDDDEEEVFRDVPDEDAPEEEKAQAQAQAQAQQKSEADASAKKNPTAYDGKKRDPEHSNADRSCLWELIPYLNHFHPAVAVSASQLMTHSPMPGKPDLTLHTLIHFLDRFIYRNPKKSATSLRGSSIMQPLAGGDSSGLLVTAGTGRHPETPVNDQSFYKKSREEVAQEEVFFHNYFSRVSTDKQRREKEENKKKKGKKGGKTGDGAGADEDDDAEGSDADEADIWEALVKSRPELEGAGDSGDDIDLDDLESAMDSDDEDGEKEKEEASEDEGEGEGDVEAASELGEQEGQVEGADDTFGAAQFDDDDEDDEEPFNFDASSEDEAFVDSDAEVPEDLTSKLEDPAAASSTKPEKDGDDKSESKKKRRKLKHLPTFASAEDYAELLKDEDDM